MIGNPYYQMLGLLGAGGKMELALATLTNVEEGVFSIEGRKIPLAGRAKGMVLENSDEGGTFLCVGNQAGWFVVCRLEEC